MTRITRLLLLGCALSVVVFLAQSTWNGLSARWIVREIPEMLDVWERQGWVTGDLQLQHAFNDLFTATAIDPQSPELHFSLARLHYWKARGLRLWPRQAAEERQRLASRLKSALVKRPTWATAWVFLAMVKLDSGGVDEELEYALNKAIGLGFYETTVQHGVAVVGMRAWSELSEDTRTVVKGAIMSSLQNWLVNRFVIEQAIATGWLGHIDHEIEANRDFQRWVREIRRERGLSS